MDQLNHLSWTQDPGAKWAKGCTGMIVAAQKDHTGPNSLLLLYTWICIYASIKAGWHKKLQNFMCYDSCGGTVCLVRRVNRGNQWLLS